MNSPLPPNELVKPKVRACPSVRLHPQLRPASSAPVRATCNFLLYEKTAIHSNHSGDDQFDYEFASLETKSAETHLHLSSNCSHSRIWEAHFDCCFCNAPPTSRSMALSTTAGSTREHFPHLHQRPVSRTRGETTRMAPCGPARHTK